MSNLDVPSPTQSAPTALDTLPPEVWERIFLFACMDGGYTGRSLSMVSKQCYALSQSSRYHSVALKRERQLVSFVVRLHDFNQDRDEGHLVELEGAAAISSSKHQVIIPKIRHLFVGLRDLFLDLGEEPEDDDEDEDYIYPGSQEGERWLLEYPDSESGESEEDEDDPEVVAADIQADLEWLRSKDADKHPPIFIAAQPDVMDEYEIAESQCSQFLRELLYSPSCLDLESLVVFAQFKHPIDLGDFIPPLKKLEALAVYSEGRISWGDFISTTPLAPTTQATTGTKPTPFYPSLRALRILGDWVDLVGAKPVWINRLLRFLRDHAPQLERIRTPLPRPYPAHLNDILDPDQFPSKVFDIVVDAPDAKMLLGTSASDKSSGYHTVDRSHKRILILEARRWQYLYYWLEDWEEVMGESGDWGGDDSWNGEWTPRTRYKGWEIGDLEISLVGLKIL
ncbi:hypothetical protein AX16_006394 [Volvariella volvacea WC 439]|nr:hypothetical protein AX16_006394 [Volvariella volvacea WC 439]